jgi:hypothetical protein
VSTRATIAGSAALFVATMLLVTADGVPGAVGGTVVDEDGSPVAGAIVRIQGTETATITGEDGAFELPAEGAVRVSAWAPEHYIGGGERVRPGASTAIVLHQIPDGDDPDYEWLSVEAAGRGEAQGCAECHRSVSRDPEHRLPVDRWEEDAHANSAVNPRFLTMYLGTDVHGNQSPPTRFAENRDYGRIPVRPDPSLPYFGPGYRLDFPDTAGNCAACHVPVAAADDPHGVDPTQVQGVAAEGIACDFCHKIWDVLLDPVTAMPDPGMPGVLSIELRRPPEGRQFFAGPFDDVAPGEDVYSALQGESAFCAPCHFGVFWDTVVYDSYGEWLRSPYSDPETGMTCQDCHMPPHGGVRFAAEAAGGLRRDPGTLHTHSMPGASDPDLLGDAVTMNATADRVEGEIEVAVSITNDRTGHHVPTDSPLRHMILLVDARSDSGTRLTQTGGPVLPVWCGIGDPGAGRFAGLPGTAYAKVLEELWTEVSPTGAYWNPTRLISDNRIPALATARTRYRFAAPQGTATVEITLLYRRAFIDLAEQKGWDVPDIPMERVLLMVG